MQEYGEEGGGGGEVEGREVEGRDVERREVEVGSWEWEVRCCWFGGWGLNELSFRITRRRKHVESKSLNFLLCNIPFVKLRIGGSSLN